MATKHSDAALEKRIESAIREFGERLRRELAEPDRPSTRRSRAGQRGAALPPNQFALPPLPAMQEEVWTALASGALMAKQIALAVYGDATSDATVRKHITRIRASGRVIKHRAGVGYYRIDTPLPPEAVPDSAPRSGRAGERSRAAAVRHRGAGGGGGDWADEGGPA